MSVYRRVEAWVTQPTGKIAHFLADESYFGDDWALCGTEIRHPWKPATGENRKCERCSVQVRRRVGFAGIR